ncbi:uncharacterized protein LOC119675810 [Teleopsis dalmanni]|uniref:uncharacterized protein LOC119675810 n=1 Tax=Teleopsis dalmanni TaxID=139649 RepID=UPI0018CF4716|nr:uncharacterized protein LOC119675810 [Teleopsis dalmanni]
MLPKQRTLILLVLLFLFLFCLKFGNNVNAAVKVNADDAKEQISTKSRTGIETTLNVNETMIIEEQAMKTNTQPKGDENDRRALSRRKRFIGFPQGSSFSCAVCLTTGVLGNPNYQYLSLGLNWGIAYNLPNSSWVIGHANGFTNSKDDKDEPMKDDSADTSTPGTPAVDGATDDAVPTDLPPTDSSTGNSTDDSSSDSGDMSPNKMAMRIIKRRHRRHLYDKLETLINK